MSKCSRQHLQYFYNASAYGLAGEIERPMRHSISAQAATTLAGSGGRGFQRIDNFSVPHFVSFDAAYTEVGGSFDDCNNQHTTFAYSVIEGLNIAGMITADRVVARMAIYSPPMPDTGDSQEASKKKSKKTGKAAAKADLEHTFDITGSYFDNLRVAGHKIDVQLATHRLHQYQTYGDLSSAVTSGADDLQPWGKLDDTRLSKLEELGDQYQALTGFGSRARQWKNNRQHRCMGGMYWCSAAGHYNLHEHFPETELHGFGGIICIPKFGVVRLAEVVIHQDRRQLHMLRVDMCSTSSGNIVGGGAGGGGGSMPPPS
jgi:hypothetical protein